MVAELAAFECLKMILSVVNTLAPTCLVGSSSFLVAEAWKTIMSRISSNSAIFDSGIWS